MKEMIRVFQNPSSEYRGAPFWAWNGKLEKEELRKQIRLMNEAGLGGFFMHARVGLETAYLSEEWFECVNVCVEEAEKLGMKAWLYDEDRWPSGAAGGLVTQHEKYRQRLLETDEQTTIEAVDWAGSIAVFKISKDNETLLRYKRVVKGDSPKLEQGESFLSFKVKVSNCSSWYNGYTYLDTMNPEAVREFITVTHEQYKNNCQKHFGDRIPGIFTDEPSFGHGNHFPWTDSIPSTFVKWYEYDILDHLPELAFKMLGDNFSKVRYHYRDCLTRLFVDAFAKQIGEWCDENNISHTGHVMSEDTLSSQTQSVGSCMRFYEYMQAPGIDLLTEYSNIYNTAKQVTSAANQFGRKWRLTETYGCTGWDFPFSGHKALGDWQAAMGLNLRCQHLAWYTMKGEAKRDYPAAIFYQSPWWTQYKKVEDYFARINYIMTQGEEHRDILVIHPVESTWGIMPCRGEAQYVEDYNRLFTQTCRSLLQANLDFDFGDEEIMSRHGKVEETDSAPILRVAKASYKTVVLPSMITIRRSTLELLRQFRNSGGQVVFAGNIPKYVDATPSDEPQGFAQKCSTAPASGSRLMEVVEEGGRILSITDSEGCQLDSVLYQLRQDHEAYYLFICNTGYSKEEWEKDTPGMMVRDRKQKYPYVTISGFGDVQGSPFEMNPDTGSIYQSEFKRVDEKLEITTSLSTLGSRLFIIPKKDVKLDILPHPSSKPIRTHVIQQEEWAITLSENNVLALSQPKYKIGDSEWSEKREILQIDRLVRKSIGAPNRGGSMVQPWARSTKSKVARTSVSLEYEFKVDSLPSGELFLALEQPETFSVTLNGHPISVDLACGWWCDESLRRIPLDNALFKKGVNKLTIVCDDYTEEHSGLEICYLLGNFGVELDGSQTTLSTPSQSLKIGDWCEQGLPFYSGAVGYHCVIEPNVNKDERLFVEIPEYRGTVVRIFANGALAGTIAWEPNEVDITDFLSEEKCDLRIELTSHRRNSHGPHHLTEKWPRWTGPGQYVAEGKDWQDMYQIVPCGLMTSPKLVIKK